MITVAVAGGSSPGLGRAVVTAIQKRSDELEVVVLSRKSSQIPAWLQDTRVEVRKVDYTSEDSLFEALQGVHTVSEPGHCCLDISKLIDADYLRSPRS